MVDMAEGVLEPVMPGLILQDSPGEWRTTHLLGFWSTSGGELPSWSWLLFQVLVGLWTLWRMLVEKPWRRRGDGSALTEEEDTSHVRAAVDSHNQTEEDAALRSMQEKCKKAKGERLVLEQYFMEEVKSKDRMTEHYDLISAELSAARFSVPELGQRVRTQEVENGKQGSRLESLLVVFRDDDKTLCEHKAARRELEAERIRETCAATALHTELEACKQDMQSRQEVQLELQNVREELLTCKAEIEVERKVAVQLLEEVRQQTSRQQESLPKVMIRRRELEQPWSQSQAQVQQQHGLSRGKVQQQRGAGALVGVCAAVDPGDAEKLDVGPLEGATALPRGGGGQRLTMLEKMASFPTLGMRKWSADEGCMAKVVPVHPEDGSEDPADPVSPCRSARVGTGWTLDSARSARTSWAPDTAKSWAPDSARNQKQPEQFFISG